MPDAGGLQMSGCALVVEGGGMRGIFSAGVLDAFMEQGFDPFDHYLGVSAGACNLSSQVAGQYNRNFRVYTTQMMRPDFISLGKFLRGGNYMDLDWLWDAFQREDPLDLDAAARAALTKRFTIVCTSVRTGRAVYLTPTRDTWLDQIKASSSVPIFYRRSCVIDGERLMDGGVADPLPAQEAIRQGARLVVVVRSRPADYVKQPGLETTITSRLLARHRELSKAIRRQPQTYNEAVHGILHPPAGAEVVHIAPTRALRTGRTTQRLEDLHADYALGRDLGLTAVAQLTPLIGR